MEKEMIKVALDAIRGNMSAAYSDTKPSDVIRNAIKDANGGTTKLKKNFYRGSKVYALVEELTAMMIDEGFRGEDELFKYVEYRNLKDGDEQKFYMEDNSLLAVSDVANGIQGIRRQRLGKGKSVVVDTVMKMVKVYDDWQRFMSGRADMVELAEAVSKAFNQKIFSDVANQVEELGADTLGMDPEYVYTGDFDGHEDDILAIIQHVEAATGKKAHILGTKTGLRKLKSAEVSDSAKESLYNIGHYGKYYGTEMTELRQAHKPGTNTFALNDSRLYIFATDDKFIKIVNEGEGYLYQGDPTENNDLTQEYTYGQAFGIVTICGDKKGILNLS